MDLPVRDWMIYNPMDGLQIMELILHVEENNSPVIFISNYEKHSLSSYMMISRTLSVAKQAQNGCNAGPIVQARTSFLWIPLASEANCSFQLIGLQR